MHVCRLTEVALLDIQATRSADKQLRIGCDLLLNNIDHTRSNITLQTEISIATPRVGSGALQNKPPRFLAECCKRRLNQGSFVLLFSAVCCFRVLFSFCISGILNLSSFRYFPACTIHDFCRNIKIILDGVKFVHRL